MGMMPENRTRRWDAIVRRHGLPKLPGPVVIPQPPIKLSKDTDKLENKTKEKFREK